LAGLGRTTISLFLISVVSLLGRLGYGVFRRVVRLFIQAESQISWRRSFLWICKNSFRRQNGFC